MWFSFFVYSVLTALLPGPNNILALNSSMKFGYRQCKSLLFGVYAGFSFVIFLSALFSEIILHRFTDILLYLKYVGALYLLYLAWAVWRSKAIDVTAMPKEEQPATNRRADFWKGFMLQLVNVKIIIYGITAFSSFIYPQLDTLAATLFFAVFLSFVGCGATWLWAIAGQKLAHFLNQHERLVNTLMALLLVYCAFSLFL